MKDGELHKTRARGRGGGIMQNLGEGPISACLGGKVKLFSKFFGGTQR